MTSLRFRPHERMRDPKDFQKAFTRRLSASDATLIVYAEPNGLGFSRLGISVGKKRVKTAVARNDIKRLIREAFRLNKHRLPLGVDWVVVPRGPKSTFEAVNQAFPTLALASAKRVASKTVTTALP